MRILKLFVVIVAMMIVAQAHAAPCDSYYSSVCSGPAGQICVNAGDACVQLNPISNITLPGGAVCDGCVSARNLTHGNTYPDACERCACTPGYRMEVQHFPVGGAFSSFTLPVANCWVCSSGSYKDTTSYAETCTSCPTSSGGTIGSTTTPTSINSCYVNCRTSGSDTTGTYTLPGGTVYYPYN